MGNKKVRTSLSISKKTLKKIDSERGIIPRSTYIESVLSRS